MSYAVIVYAVLDVVFYTLGVHFCIMDDYSFVLSIWAIA